MNTMPRMTAAGSHRRRHPMPDRLLISGLLVALLVTAGCSTRRLAQPAPVEDRTGAAGAVDVKQLPGAENAGKPGYYTVRPGDVLEYEVPDMYGRPWAGIWEEHFEQHMERP